MIHCGGSPHVGQYRSVLLSERAVFLDTWGSESSVSEELLCASVLTDDAVKASPIRKATVPSTYTTVGILSSVCVPSFCCFRAAVWFAAGLLLLARAQGHGTAEMQRKLREFLRPSCSFVLLAVLLLL